MDIAFCNETLQTIMTQKAVKLTNNKYKQENDSERASGQIQQFEKESPCFSIKVMVNFSGVS
jgi:hypothetical protein